MQFTNPTLTGTGQNTYILDNINKIMPDILIWVKKHTKILNIQFNTFGINIYSGSG